MRGPGAAAEFKQMVLDYIDLARASALGWLRAVPTDDRVLLVRADALATPASAWETDRRTIARAILETQPGPTSLNLSQNLEFASQLQHGSGSLPGEIVYAGPGCISTREANNLTLPRIPAFRVLALDDNIENSGIRSLGQGPLPIPVRGTFSCGFATTAGRRGR